jgi:hypothetical protein
LFSVVSPFIAHSGNAAEHFRNPECPAFPRLLSDYHDSEIPGLIYKLGHRVKAEPFNLISNSDLFLCDRPTFLTSVSPGYLAATSMSLMRWKLKRNILNSDPTAAGRRGKVQFRAQAWGFMGELKPFSESG